MKTLSHLCIALAAIALTFSSCKKSSNNPTPDNTVTSSMKLTANGTDINFNDCEEIEIDVNGQAQTTFTGYQVANGKHSDVSFGLNVVHDPTTFKAGQTFQASSSFDPTNSATLVFWPNSTDSYMLDATAPQGTVTITAVTATTISGTFSGKLYVFNDPTAATQVYTITNGSFTAKINK
jgi:hypothetical protein